MIKARLAVLVVMAGAASVALITMAAPAYAEWFGMIHDAGEIRQASLTGMSDTNHAQQINLSCTTAGDYHRSLNIGIYLPATGEYAVRQGDEAEAVLSTADTKWTVAMAVDTNGSSGFGAAVDSETVLEIVQAMEAAPAEMSVTFTAGTISETFAINTKKLGSRATEFLDACGR